MYRVICTYYVYILCAPRIICTNYLLMYSPAEPQENEVLWRLAKYRRPAKQEPDEKENGCGHNTEHDTYTIYVYIYIYTYIHTYIHTYIYEPEDDRYVCMCVCVYIYKH